MAHFSSHPLRASRHRARWHVLALLLALLGLCLPLASQAQAPKAGAAPSFFQPDVAAARGSAGSAAGRALLLDTTALRAVLRQVPAMGASARGGVGTGVLMALPLPDGSTGRFRIYESSVMAPELAARYPQIKTYSGVGIDDLTATIALDMTPLGFHAQVLSNIASTSYIDPVGDAAALHYRCIARQDMPNSKLSCGVGALPGTSSPVAPSSTGAALRYGSTGANTYMMTLRLALACAPGYSALFGNNVTNILSAVNTSIARVTGIYERELGVHLEMVQNTGTLFFTPANTPPTAYNENSFSQCLDANMFNLKALVPVADYDIGHVFVGPSTGEAAGLASVGVVFKNTYREYGSTQAGKARGVTGLSAGYSTGDLHDVRVVAHEMGHQMGADHVFNGTAGSCSGNRNGPTAVEPGSGSTIMSYGGNCGTDNYNPVIPKPGLLTVNLKTAIRLYLEQFVDDYFNTVSYEQIQETLYANAGITGFVTRGYALESGRLVAAGARPAALTRSVKTRARNEIFIPKQTPFKLTLAAPLQTGITYCWEESDTGGGGKSLPTMQTQQAGESYPLFRSQKPTASADRYFPSIENILRAKQAQATLAYPEETLPTVTRSLDFTCTARNLISTTTSVTPSYTPAGTYMVGGIRTITDEVQATSTAGPFKVTTSGKTHFNKAQPRVYLTWDVANTTASTTGSVNCQALMLSYVVKAADGTYTVTADAAHASFPNNGFLLLDDTYWDKILMVSALQDDNYFFDIGYPDRDVTGGKPTTAKIASLLGLKNLAKSLTASSSSSTVNLSSPTGTGAAGIAAQTNTWSATQRATGVYSFQYGGKTNATLDISKVLNDEGTGIRITAYDPGSVMQQFLLEDVGDGRFRVLAGDDSGRLLEAYTPTGSTTSTVRLVPYVDLASATEGQKWDLDPIYADFVTGQAYNLQSANGHNLLLNGTAVQLATQNENTTLAQKWTVNEPATGYYTFTSVATTTQLLTVASGALTTATANAATTAATANTQYFKLVPSSATGYYKVLNVVSNLYLQQSTAGTGGLALTATATAAGTDWRFNDVLIPGLPITIANTSNSSTLKYVAPDASGNAVLSGTSTGWTVGKVAVVGVTVVGALCLGAAIATAIAGASAIALLQLTSAVVITVATASNIGGGVGLCLQTPFASPRRALLATEDGTLEETYRLGLLANGKYLIFDYNGDHVMTRQSDGSIAEADYTGAADQQWDLAPTAPLTATLYSPGVAYGEYSQTFGIGDYSTLVGSTVGNDAVTRLVVPTGLNVTLYEDADFAGSAWNFRSNANQLPTGAQRSVSSVMVQVVKDVLQDGALYKIVSRSGSGNQVMQVGAGNTVSVGDFTGSTAQYWMVIKGIDTNGGNPIWTFIAQNNTSMCLDINGYNSRQNTPAYINQYSNSYTNAALSQYFQLTPTSDGYSHIITNYTSTPVLCLQTTANGVQLGGNTGTSNPLQEWRFERVNPAVTVYQNASLTYTGGGYAIPLTSGRYTSAQLTNLGITAGAISALKVNADYEILLFAGTDFTGRSWRYQADVNSLTAANGGTAQSLIVQLRTDELIDGQVYTLINASTNNVLQVLGYAAGTAVSAGIRKPRPNHEWMATRVSGTSTWSFSPQNAPALRLTNTNTANEQATITSSASGATGVSYQLTPTGNGNFQLNTASQTYCLQESTTGTVHAVQLATPTGSLTQQWRFTPSAPVTVYAGPDFTGAAPLAVDVTYSKTALLALGLGQTSSGDLLPGSLRVIKGYEVLLYASDDATGTAVARYLGNRGRLGITCGSLKVRRAGTGATMFTGPRHTGNQIVLLEGTYTADELAMRGLDANAVAGLTVEPGYEVLVFDNDDFTGSQWHYRSILSTSTLDQPDLTLDLHGNNASNQAESIIVRPIVQPVNGATYWIQPVQAPSLALGSSTGVANGTVAATTFDYTLSPQKWVVEMDALGLWSLRQPGANYLDAPDRNIGTALTYGSPGFFPQAFHLVNVEDNIWRIMGRNGLVCATLNADNTIGFAAPLALGAPSQSWYFSLAASSSADQASPALAQATPPAVTLYPNPATATITLQDLPAGATVTVLDLMGKTVLTSTKAVISIAGLPAGVYIAVVGRQHVRFIKQ